MARLSPTFYLLAAALSMLGVVAHEWLGAPQILGPLETSGLPPDVVWMNHFSWYVDTVAVLAMVVMFFLAARRRDHVALAVIASAMSAAFAVIGMAWPPSPMPRFGPRQRLMLGGQSPILERWACFFVLNPIS